MMPMPTAAATRAIALMAERHRLRAQLADLELTGAKHDEAMHEAEQLYGSVDPDHGGPLADIKRLRRRLGQIEMLIHRTASELDAV